MNFKTAVGAATGVTFSSPYAAKFQSVGNKGGSWELEGCLEGATGCNPRPPQEVPEPGSLALAGRPEDAISSLSKAILLGYDDLAHIDVDPDLDSLRERPDFRALLGRD